MFIHYDAVRQHLSDLQAEASRARLAAAARDVRRREGRRRARVLRVEVEAPVSAPAAIVADVYADYARWPSVFPMIAAVRHVGRSGSWDVLRVDHRRDGVVRNELRTVRPGVVELRESKPRYDATFVNEFTDDGFADDEPTGDAGRSRFRVRADVRLAGAARFLRPVVAPLVRHRIRTLQIDPVRRAAEQRARTVVGAGPPRIA